AVELEGLLVSLDAPELSFHGIEPPHARRDVPGGPVRRVQHPAQRRERADRLALLFGRVVAERPRAWKRPLELRVNRSETVAECLALLHERIHLGERRVDLAPVWGPELPHGGELLLELLALQVHLLEPARVVEHVPREVRGIEDDPAPEQTELRPGGRGGDAQSEPDGQACGEEPRPSQRVREPTTGHRGGLLAKGGERGGAPPRWRGRARRAGPPASRRRAW